MTVWPTYRCSGRLAALARARPDVVSTLVIYYRLFPLASGPDTPHRGIGGSRTESFGGSRTEQGEFSGFSAAYDGLSLTDVSARFPRLFRWIANRPDARHDTARASPAGAVLGGSRTQGGGIALVSVDREPKGPSPGGSSVEREPDVSVDREPGWLKCRIGIPSRSVDREPKRLSGRHFGRSRTRRQASALRFGGSRTERRLTALRFGRSRTQTPVASGVPARPSRFGGSRTRAIGGDEYEWR